MDDHRQNDNRDTSLPLHARLPVNRCNLPSMILGSLTFQNHPTRLYIDGVDALHGDFFKELDLVEKAEQRAELFKAFMRASFYLDRPNDIGLNKHQRVKRDKADYLRMLRGWLFDSDAKEGAVLKSWVESRFGLLPRNHGGTLNDFNGENYQRYLAARSAGIYNTNAIEAQLDLLYTYAQYELTRRYPSHAHFKLYRGINRIKDHEVLDKPDKNTWVVILNNLNSFTADAERADEFGDQVINAQVPLSKLLYFPGLLPGTLKGEQEYLVIGGIYRVQTTPIHH